MLCSLKRILSKDAFRILDHCNYKKSPIISITVRELADATSLSYVKKAHQKLNFSIFQLTQHTCSFGEKKSLLENVIENYKNNFQEAEQNGFTAEDVQVALNHCGDANPVAWLKENWDNMMETVVTLGMVTNKM